MSFFDAIQKTLTSPFWKDPFCLCRFKMLYSKLRPSPATTSATTPTPTPAPKHKLKSKWWDRERGIYGKRGGSLILLILSCHLGSGAGQLWRGEFGRLLVLLYFHILWCLWMEARFQIQCLVLVHIGLLKMFTDKCIILRHKSCSRGTSWQPQSHRIRF